MQIDGNLPNFITLKNYNNYRFPKKFVGGAYFSMTRNLVSQEIQSKKIKVDKQNELCNLLKEN
jgi:hypothetical protein